MVKIRIGKNVGIRWRITTNGEDVPLEGRNLTLFIRHPYMQQKQLDMRVVDGNVVAAVFRGVEQHHVGVYTLTLYEDYGLDTQNITDRCDAFELVRCSCEELTTGDLSTNDIEVLMSDFIAGVEGLSAYEVAVKEGFIGSEAEWLDSLKEPARNAATDLEAQKTVWQSEINEMLAKMQAKIDESETINYILLQDVCSSVTYALRQLYDIAKKGVFVNNEIYNIETLKILIDAIQESIVISPVDRPIISIKDDGAMHIYSSTEGASIYYTTDGSLPQGTSELYEDDVYLENSCVVRAVAIKDGVKSAITTSVYSALPDNCVAFGDDATKLLFISNAAWNTDGDDNMTFDEMAAITSIATEFQGNTDIVSLNCLAYTKIANIQGGYPFKGMSNLETIVFPSSISGFKSALSTTSDSTYNELKAVFILEGNGDVSLQPIDNGVNYAPKLEVVDYPKRMSKSGRTPFNYYGWQGSNAANIVLRSNTCVTPSDSTYRGKNLFVPPGLVDSYKSTANYVTMFGDNIHPIGGDKWAAEFGSTDEWADYQKYGVYKYKDL